MGSVAARAAPYLLLVVAGAAYGFYSRLMTYPTDAPIGVWNLILDVACGPQLFTYVVLPAWLVLVLRHAHVWWTPARLIRLGSASGFLMFSTRRGGATLALGMLSVVLGSAAAGLGLSFPAWPAPDSAAGRFLAAGIAPAVALGLQLSLLFLLLGSLAVLLSAAYMWSGHLWVPVALSIAVFAWSASSANGLVGGAANLLAAVDAAAIASATTPGLLIAIVAAAMVCLLAVYLHDRHAITVRSQ